MSEVIETTEVVEATYQTRHLGFAAFLLYVLGDDSLVEIRTTTDLKGSEKSEFIFRDSPVGTCADLQRQFFSEGSAAVGDARELLETSRRIRQFATNATREARQKRKIV